MEDAIGRIVTPVLDRLADELGAHGSAVLYGSAARGEYRAGVSDINLMLIVDSLDPGSLRRLSGALDEFRRERQAPPLLMQRDEWLRAVDVFPIEIADMQLAREVLRGADPLEGLRVHPGDLRRALERELRGKLIRLRQTYALHAASPGALGDAAGRTVGSIAALLRTALLLYRSDPPRATPACLTELGRTSGIPTRPVADLWERRAPKGFTCEPALFESYLAAVSAAVRVIDQFTRGGN
jgi:predicted nucleotidyltransferase